MTMTIGRCSLTQDPYNLEVSGDVVSFSFDLVPTAANDVDEMKARRQQLLGLVNNDDEEVVPFTWSEDSTFDGFYRVRAITVPSATVMLSTGVVPTCQITLERFGGGYANPWFEVVVQSIVRTNSVGITIPDGVLAAYYDYPTRALDTSVFGGVAGGIRESEGGPLYSVIRGGAPSGLASYRYTSAPSNYYVNTCVLEIKYGSTWYPVNGKQVFDNVNDWRISNGIVRLTGGASASTFEVNNNTTWESQSVGLIRGGTGAIRFGQIAAAGTVAMEVLRNGPETVTVRTIAKNIFVTYTIQLGTRHVEINHIDGNGAGAVTWGVGFTAATVTASITGGIRKSTNDANGNRMVFGSPNSGVTKDNVNGRITILGTLTGNTFMVGVEFDGTAATAQNTAADIIGDFHAVASFMQRVVRR